MKFMEIETNILISTMMNLDKFLLKNPKLIINKYNCYKIFFLCLLETNKLLDDFNIPDKILYKIGILKTNELILLESEFLYKIEYSLFIHEKDFFNYKIKLENLFELRIGININNNDNDINNNNTNFIKENFFLFDFEENKNIDSEI